MKESAALKELHDIREKNAQRMKNMTKDEKIKYIIERAEKGSKAFKDYINETETANVPR